VSEKALRILRGDRIERAVHRFDQCLPASALRFSQDTFYLAEGLFYGVVVSSALGGLPPPFLGVSESPRPASLA
jgi:hypothetical protein